MHAHMISQESRVEKDFPLDTIPDMIIAGLVENGFAKVLSTPDVGDLSAVEPR